MRFMKLLVFIATMALTVVSPAVAQDDIFKGCKVVPLPAAYDMLEQRVVELTNDHRASIGLPPLKRVTLLDETARYHANDMRVDDYFSHDTMDRLPDVGDATHRRIVCDFTDRVMRYYKGYLGAENIAYGHQTPEEVVSAWLNSPGHRENIENRYPREIGVGVAVMEMQYQCGTLNAIWWVQNFGARHGVHPLVINREYARTNNPQVEIYIYGRWSQMRLRNDNGPWGPWQPFANQFAWTLEPVPGTRQVCAELRHGKRREITCDTIILDTQPPETHVTSGSNQ